MKKIITVFCGTLLAAVLMLSMAACGGNGGGKNLIDSDTNTKITYSVQEIADLSGWDLEGSIDSLGFCVFSKYNTENAENEYMLYNLITAEKYVSAEEFSKISDGLYYTGQESADAMSYTFNYYGKGGSAKTYTVTYNESDPDSSMEEANNAQYALFADNTFDITLLFGPMYHLYTTEDQKQALSEAIRVTKTNGIVFTSYCMADPVLILHGFGNGEIRDFISRGKVDRTTFSCYSGKKDIFQLYRKEQIVALRENFPCEPLHYVATDGCTNCIRRSIDKMSKDDFDLYLQYHFLTCEQSDMTGMSDHTLDIFRKIG